MRFAAKLGAAALAFGMAAALASNAFAAATLHDVETAVKVNHDEVQGEKLMREVVAGAPDNARYHYIFAQILEKNGKHSDALREFNEMKRLDSSYSFDANPSRVADFGDRLANENKSSHMLLWVVLGLVGVGIGGWFLFRRTAEKDKEEDEARLKTQRQDQLKQASTLLESVKPLRLDIRMAATPDTALLGELDDTEKELINLVERLSEAPVAQREIDAQSEKLAQLRRRFEGKPDPAAQAAAQPAVQAVPQSVPVQNSTQGTVYQGSSGFGMPQQVDASVAQGAPTVVGGVMNNGTAPVYQPAAAMPPNYPPAYPQAYPQGYPLGMQQPMVVEQNSGMGVVGGIVAGAVLGEMLSGGHQTHEVVREIHEVREVPVYEEPRRHQAPADDIDFADDGGGSVTSNGSSDVDFGDDT